MDSGLQVIVQFLTEHIVWPLAGFLTHLYLKVQSQDKTLAVLEARVESEKKSNERELQEIRNLFQQAFSKLDSIEEFLRRNKNV